MHMWLTAICLTSIPNDVVGDTHKISVSGLHTETNVVCDLNLPKTYCPRDSALCSVDIYFITIPMSQNVTR